jgi:hypothetical protein
MTTTQNDSPLGNLVSDSMRFGPAPTRAREGAVILSTFVLLAVIISIVAPPVVYTAIVAAAIVVNFAIRWAVGSRKWGSR